ncbi:MAG: hypothetical protein KGD63_02865 [Candidatus Lokiarchaeota archaeon]|nr:hypothetical protein [Candidatus Lokiarchaeota archaeon]
MAKKKKEQCPFCGDWFTYLSRHKCKVQARIENKEDEKSATERRIERIGERKKLLTRNLRKEETKILEIIDRKGNLFFFELVEIVKLDRNRLEEIIELLALQSKIKVKRELRNASWSKHIFAIEDLEKQISVKEIKVDQSKLNWIWWQFGRQPCFICPYTEQCSDDNPDVCNPHHCPLLTKWIEASLEGIEYIVNFEEILQKTNKK